jgi:hypothetical protein
MDAAGDTKSTKPSCGRRLWDFTRRYPQATALALYGLIALAAAAAAYFAIFSQFDPYDDEGALLVTLKGFAEGETLYRDVYSAYGPFYYELFGGFFALTGAEVTTNASRLLVIFVWVTTSLFFGLAAQRLTERLLLGATAMMVAFGTLAPLVTEPMHPHGLCVLLLSGFVALLASGPGRRVALSGALGGALLAALLLTKVNLGVFALTAVAVAGVLTVERLHRLLWLRWLVLGAFIAMPVAITGRDLGKPWVWNMVGVEVLAMAAIFVAAWPLRSKHGEDDGTLARWLVGAAAGLLVAAGAILGAIFLTGPSPADVYDGIVGEAIRIRDVLVSPFPLAQSAVDWGIAAVAAAVLAVLLRDGRDGAQSIWPGLARITAGLAIWFTIVGVMPISIGLSAGNNDTLPLLLAWVAVLAPADALEPAYRRFVRVLLPALAVAETLQVYPVAGTQMAIAAVIYVPVGAICLADGLACLRAWSVARGGAMPDRLSTVVGVATVALVASFAINSIGRPGAMSGIAYRHQPPAPLAGAGLMHLPAPTIETYVGLVELLHRNRCTGLIGYPSLPSVYLWSGIGGPKPINGWMTAYDEERQQRIVNELRATPRPCAFRSDEQAARYLGGEPPPDLPLVNYVLKEFRPAGRVGEFDFLLPGRTDSRQAHQPAVQSPTTPPG